METRNLNEAKIQYHFCGAENEMSHVNLRANGNDERRIKNKIYEFCQGTKCKNIKLSANAQDGNQPEKIWT